MTMAGRQQGNRPFCPAVPGTPPRRRAPAPASPAPASLRRRQQRTAMATISRPGSPRDSGESSPSRPWAAHRTVGPYRRVADMLGGVGGRAYRNSPASRGSPGPHRRGARRRQNHHHKGRNSAKAAGVGRFHHWARVLEEPGEILDHQLGLGIGGKRNIRLPSGSTSETWPLAPAECGLPGGIRTGDAHILMLASTSARARHRRRATKAAHPLPICSPCAVRTWRMK